MPASGITSLTYQEVDKGAAFLRDALAEFQARDIGALWCGLSCSRMLERTMRNLDEIAARVAARLIERGETIAVSESSAGGLIAAALLAIPGASSYFLGGAVVYTATAREALLGITRDDMAGMRSASEPYAALLARTLRERFGASWTLAETGAAGPTGNRYGDAAGHACFAISGPSEAVRTLETGSTDRAANMRAFAVAALALLEDALGPALNA